MARPVPNKCCPMGSYACTVPIPTRQHRVEHIDYCIADIVAALNAANIRTVASCCGHGEIEASIVLEDGRHLRFEMGEFLENERKMATD